MGDEAIVRSGPPTPTELAAGKFPDDVATVHEVRAFERKGELPERIAPRIYPPGRRNALLFRRSLIAQLIIQGYTHKQITEYIAEAHPELAVSEYRIHEIVAELRAQWRQNYERTTAEACEQELKKLDALEAAVVELHASGELKDFSDQMLKIAKRRANLLGLDQARKIEVNGKILGGMLSDDDLENIISGGKSESEKLLLEGNNKG